MNQDATVSVVVPVHNGGAAFKRCLASITAALPAPLELIVVADGDTDGSWRVAGEFGARVIRTPERRGPARARNLGAREAGGAILLFLDADVEAPRDIIKQVQAVFRERPFLAAVFGSYDEQPAERNFLSQYKNLFHHYTHQKAKEEASTFWGACGAIRREIFLGCGGFDESYVQPSIEDIELGYRLKKRGKRILLLKTLQVKHLKRWGTANLLRADFFYRALPWTRLIQRDGLWVNDLNLTRTSRISVALVFCLLFGTLEAFFVPWAVFPLLVLPVGLLWLNRDVYRFFRAKRGTAFAIKVIPWHWFYYLYSGIAFLLGSGLHAAVKIGARLKVGPTTAR